MTTRRKRQSTILGRLFFVGPDSWSLVPRLSFFKGTPTRYQDVRNVERDPHPWRCDSCRFKGKCLRFLCADEADRLVFYHEHEIDKPTDFDPWGRCRTNGVVLGCWCRQHKEPFILWVPSGCSDIDIFHFCGCCPHCHSKLRYCLFDSKLYLKPQSRWSPEQIFLCMNCPRPRLIRASVRHGTELDSDGCFLYRLPNPSFVRGAPNPSGLVSLDKKRWTIKHVLPKADRECERRKRLLKGMYFVRPPGVPKGWQMGGRAIWSY